MLEPTFPEGEYAGRVGRVCATMRERGLQQLLVFDPANLNYLIGYNCWSMYTPQMLVVSDSGEVVFYTREVDASGAVLTTHLSADQVIGFPERFVQQPDCHPMDWVSESMRERGIASGTIGAESESYFHTVRAHQALVSGLPDATIVDAQSLVNWARAVKSDAELALMRIAGKIVTRAMNVAIEGIAPGVRQCDAVADICDAQIRGLPDHGGDYTSIIPMLPTGEGTGVPHITWSDKPFVSGEATVIEIAGCHQRYHSPLARTVYLGTPPQKLADMAEIVGEGMEAALATVKPGARAEDVEASWREVISHNGLSKSGRIGYSVGVNYPPDWGEHTMSLRPGDTTVLEPGMAFHMILGMWLDGWGYELSETFVVTDANAECLADVPRGLVVKT